jgi:hypothetical protein
VPWRYKEGRNWFCWRRMDLFIEKGIPELGFKENGLRNII